MKSILKYYLPNQEFTFEELDKLSGKKDGLWTWAQRAKINLLKMGFKIVEIENWDIDEFVNSGKVYLIKRYGKEVAEVQTTHSDLDEARIDYEEYGKYKILENKIPTFEDIKRLLDEGYLVCCNVNSKALNKKEGYSGHFVTVIGYENKHLFLHDPGLPAQKNRKVSLIDFKKAWAFPDNNAQNLTAFRLK